MHKLKVLILGPNSFAITLNELKPFLKFIPLFSISDTSFDVILFHNKALHHTENKILINKSNVPKICAVNSKEKMNDYDACLELPTSINFLNSVVTDALAKNKFYQNSSINIKNYLLNKNEKKLFKQNSFVVLTEKEIQLLELFLNQKEPITKDIILDSVWHYSSDADTHTVETHIYRLRKKISEKFFDDKFILNNKAGYYL